MRHADFVYRGQTDGPSGPVAHGVAHGMTERYGRVEAGPLPPRLRALVGLLVDREAASPPDRHGDPGGSQA
jgi:hypothetical protein